MRATAVVLLAAVLGMGAMAGTALGDGDPGSDVLVYQDLFVAADAGMSISQQSQLGALLQKGARAGFPIRVAIISGPSDLGAVTALWHKPQAYARFLGYELSLAYKQRLLVVMPNGFGFNWPGHSTAATSQALARVAVHGGGAGLFSAAQSAVRTLAADAGVKLSGSASASTGAPTAGTAPAGQAATSPPVTATAETAGAASGGSGGSANAGQGTDTIVAGVAIALFALAGLFFGGRYALARAHRRLSASGDAPGADTEPRPRVRPRVRVRHAVIGVGALVVLGAAGPVLMAGSPGASGASERTALATNPYLDPGTQLSRAAPDFTLVNQFGRRVSLSSFRGRVVLLAFTDSECTTICPMTTTAMLTAKAMLGAAGSRVALLGVDANPASTSIEDVSSYSQLHGMTHAWDFLTGSLSQLRRVWKAYAIDAAVERGIISHTPALMVISPQGREAKIYMTQQSYSAVGQLGQIVAQEASSLLPGHPRVDSKLSYAPVKTITPRQTTRLPRAGGGTVAMGPARSARLSVFFATWTREITGLAGNLQALNRYQSAAAASGLPPLTAVDEGPVEPSSVALPDFLRTLGHPLSYPVAIDRSGQVADGYEVLGQPWFVLTSPTGRILWYQDVSTSGWPSDAKLLADVRAALARTPSASTSGASVTRALAGSPAPLALVHQQANRLLGSQSALDARVRALRGYPIVINAWASWCSPCRSEFGLFANASALYGRKVAFLGADAGDSPGDARAFLAQHPVSYPSYQTNLSDLNSLAPVGLYLPTTIFINRSGKIVYTHIGQYDTQGSLDGDIASYAGGG
ncbi:MAG TPA: redoxin domain-containing protein [Solirubrobacteraceae bacterium]|jgi:cytochrome oxidase Cu insertion factor (SCO1/SenC/PrrC family)/thiol-disulfide isomerase/thioredoxin|nr:redoxin domain-containing protein [Solirubrobacteraceae bacterium]